MKYYKAVVIYNQFINKSKSCDSLKGQEYVIVFDNSNMEYLKTNKKICIEYGFEYFTLNKNIGLSKAYNYIVELLQEREEEFYISWFDDDTTVSLQYFESMIKEIDAKEGDVLVPIVVDAAGLLSPSKMLLGFYPHRAKDAYKISTNKLTAINSGMCVHSIVFNKVKYNESMFLDCIDHYFIEKVKAKNFKIKIVNTVIEQAFSETSNSTKEQAIARFNIYAADFSKAYKGIIPKIYLLIRGLRRAIKYKDFAFLQVFG